MDHILSELSTMTHLSWVALQGMGHSFIELHKSLLHIKAVIHEGTEGVASVNKPHLFSPQIKFIGTELHSFIYIVLAAFVLEKQS